MENMDRVADLVAGKYRLIQKINEGSFGKIYQAYDIQTNQNVAVKFV